MIIHYTNSFLKMLYENIPEEHDAEIRNYLQTKINQNLVPEQEDGTSLKFWGDEKIGSLLVQWARRLILLDQLNKLIE